MVGERDREKGVWRGSCRAEWGFITVGGVLRSHAVLASLQPTAGLVVSRVSRFTFTRSPTELQTRDVLPFEVNTREQSRRHHRRVEYSIGLRLFDGCLVLMWDLSRMSVSEHCSVRLV